MENTKPTEKVWPMLAHLSALAGILWTLIGFFGPLFVWMLKKDTDPETNYHARRSMNWQLTVVAIFLLSVGVYFVCHSYAVSRLESVMEYHKQQEKLGQPVEMAELERRGKIAESGSNLIKLFPQFLIGFQALLALLNAALIVANSYFAFKGKKLWYPPSVRAFKTQSFT